MLIYCSLIKITVTLLGIYVLNLGDALGDSDLYTVFVQPFFMFLFLFLAFLGLPKSERVIVFLTILTEHQGFEKLITLLNLKLNISHPLVV